MDSKQSPQLNNSGQSEIYRLLKIGEFAVKTNEVAIEITNKTKEKLQEIADKNVIVKKIVTQIADILGPVKGLLIYPAIFFGSFLIFYLAMNFPSLAASASGLFVKSQDQQILGEELAAYNKWIGGYFYTVQKKDLLAATNDYDSDGLTNYDEFVMRTNPTMPDSDKDGTSDGVELLNLSNPWGAGKLTAAQTKLLDKINLNMVSERISFAVSANQGKAQIADEANNFDLTRPGVLAIPKLKIQVPLIFSKDPSEFDADLQKGVIHYPGTSLPGNIGTVYVSGHSSDYIWKRDKFATIFTKINYLNSGDDVFVTVYGKDGKVYNYRYRVTGQKIYAPDDQTQFIDNSTAKLNLSTCWPIGTAKSRMVVSAELAGL